MTAKFVEIKLLFPSGWNKTADSIQEYSFHYLCLAAVNTVETALRRGDVRLHTVQEKESEISMERLTIEIMLI